MAATTQILLVKGSFDGQKAYSGVACQSICKAGRGSSHTPAQLPCQRNANSTACRAVSLSRPAVSASPPTGDDAAGLYTPFVEHCLSAMAESMPLEPLPIRPDWRRLRGSDGDGGTPAVCRSDAAAAPKLRLLRTADISAGATLQVLNLIAFPKPEFAVPFFCADLVTFARGHLIVLDVNPLFKTREYHQRFIRPYMPLCKEFARGLPWGGEFTSESLQFFSPALLWSKLPLSADVVGAVLPAFDAYLQVWLDQLEQCEEETDPQAIARNMEAQHRYICWRCVKDPGRPLLTRLFGTERCEEFIEGFLFAGSQELGSKGFLDYFPQYRMPDGSICKKRSMAGKSYSTRLWDGEGNLLEI